MAEHCFVCGSSENELVRSACGCNFCVEEAPDLFDEVESLRMENNRLRAALTDIENMYPDGPTACGMAREALAATRRQGEEK